MSEMKLVRNEGGPLKVEFGGSDYFFAAGEEREVAADLADVCSYRHGHEGFKIVNLAHEADEARKRGEDSEAALAQEKLAAQAVRDQAALDVEQSKATLAAADARVAFLLAGPQPAAAEAEPEPEAPRTFVCPNGDYSSNDEADYNVHLASAHGLGAQARKDVEAAALPDAVKALGGVATKPAEVVPTAESPSVDNPPVQESPSTEPVKES